MRRSPWLFLCLVMLFTGSIGRVQASDEEAPPLERCKQILELLWSKQGGETMPGIILRSIGQYGKPAEYDPASNQIVIDPKAYRICLNYSRNGDDALAFLIAHELVHSYQRKFFDYTSVGFFAKSGSLKDWARAERERRKRMETKADIWGAILCYMSGYKVDDILPGFIEHIYQSFNLAEEDPLYDSKNERLDIARRSKEEIEKTIVLFEMANYLNVLQQHDKDTVIYRYLIDDFRSAEFYNNLGLSYVMLALPKVPEPFRSCPYPLTLDMETRLEQVMKSRPKSPGELLSFGIRQFDEAMILSKDYLPLRINRASAYHLLSAVDDVHKGTYIQKAKDDIGFVRRMNLRAYDGPQSQGEQLLDHAQLLSNIITYPSRCPDRKKIEPVVAPASEFARIQQLKFHWEVEVSYADNITVSGKKFSNTILALYQNGSSGEKFYLQRVLKDMPALSAKYKAFIYPIGTKIPTRELPKMRRSRPTLQGDYFLIYDKIGMIYKMGADDRIKEWALFRGV